MRWALSRKPEGRQFDSHQGTCLGCGPGPQWGFRERQPHIDVSLPLLLPPFPSLRINRRGILLDFIYLFLERGREGAREGGKH